MRRWLPVERRFWIWIQLSCTRLCLWQLWSSGIFWANPFPPTSPKSPPMPTNKTAQCSLTISTWTEPAVVLVFVVIRWCRNGVKSVKKFNTRQMWVIEPNFVRGQSCGNLSSHLGFGLLLALHSASTFHKPKAKREGKSPSVDPRATPSQDRTNSFGQKWKTITKRRWPREKFDLLGLEFMPRSIGVWLGVCLALTWLGLGWGRRLIFSGFCS